MLIVKCRIRRQVILEVACPALAQEASSVGGPGSITRFTTARRVCAINDARSSTGSKVQLTASVRHPAVGDRYQISIGGAVQSVFNEINSLPSMKSGAAASNDDVRSAASRL